MCTPHILFFIILLLNNHKIFLDNQKKSVSLQAIGNKPQQDAYRGTLKGFYGTLKSKDGCIKFALLCQTACNKTKWHQIATDGCSRFGAIIVGCQVMHVASLDDGLLAVDDVDAAWQLAVGRE